MVSRRMPVAVVTALALTGLVPAGAAAATSVQQAIASESKIISREPGLRDAEHLGDLRRSQDRRIARQVVALETALFHAAVVVRAASATPSQAVAQRSWASGAQDEARGYGALAAKLLDLAARDSPGATLAGRSSAELLAEGREKIADADRLFGITPTF